MEGETNRRSFLHGGAVATAGLLAGAPTAAGQEPADHQEHAGRENANQEFLRDRPSTGGPVGSATDRGKLVPGLIEAGAPPVLVETPDIAEKLTWRMVDGVKEFHLRCRNTQREFLPNLWIDVWGYADGLRRKPDGSPADPIMPGPTIEVNQGDRVRVVVFNELPESTTMHWHGLEVPVSQDGVPGLTQDPIKPGETFTYEFTVHQHGTFFYHSHDGMQDGMGMVGLFIIHPQQAYEPRVDRDFALVIQEWAILPASTVPNTMSMEFNLFTMNGRAAPYITPIVCKLGERVRIRLVNFSAIDHHPMHLHGLTFWITGTEAGRIPNTAWIPSNNVLIAVAQARDIEFVANNPGDWMVHCHMFHHMMNFMSSRVGPMAGHSMQGMPAGGDMATSMGMLTSGPALSQDVGPFLGRGLGEQLTRDRTVGNMTVMPGTSGRTAGMAGMAGMGTGGHGGHGAMNMAEASQVPGYPQGMMDMAMERSPAELAKLNKRQTRGMRSDWFTGVEGLMTVVRVLPPDLYDQVMSGKGEVPAGASVPDGRAEVMPEHTRH